ncbi:Protein tyrosine phosphatase type IVA 1 [Chytridiales sp. JEL 0842]|nr:Protein tyrosine phosphatase type IVA 1 [Chytridiales sp. JEL 0842]
MSAAITSIPPHSVSNPTSTTTSLSAPPASATPVSSGSQSPALSTSTVTTTTGKAVLSRPIPFNRVMTSIEYRNMRFVVFDCPSEDNLNQYLDELKLRNVTDIVRACEMTYDKKIVEDRGIKVTDLPFPDGSIPPPLVIQTFLALCDDR